jgi:hypothetical protein
MRTIHHRCRQKPGVRALLLGLLSYAITTWIARNRRKRDATIARPIRVEDSKRIAPLIAAPVYQPTYPVPVFPKQRLPLQHRSTGYPRLHPNPVHLISNKHQFIGMVNGLAGKTKTESFTFIPKQKSLPAIQAIGDTSRGGWEVHGLPRIPVGSLHRYEVLHVQVENLSMHMQLTVAYAYRWGVVAQ